MARTRRYIFNTLTMVSLLLMLATVGLWVNDFRLLQDVKLMMDQFFGSIWYYTTLSIILVFLVVSYFVLDRRRKQGNRRDDNTCPSCGYDLTGNETGVCPECGVGVETTSELT